MEEWAGSNPGAGRQFAHQPYPIPAPPRRRSHRTVITIAVVGAVIAVIAGVAGVLGLVRSPNSPVSGLLYSRQTVLPFTGLKDPTGVAVDAEGNVYITDAGNRRVLKLAAGSGSQTVLPFTGLQNLTGVAVDDKGTVYVSYFTDGFPGVGKVVKLAAGSNSQTALPFTDLADPRAVAVDPGGECLRRRPPKTPSRETRSGVEQPDRAAVHRAGVPARCGGRRGGRRLRHRHPNL